MERSHRHDYKNGQQHLDIHKAQPIRIPQINQKPAARPCSGLSWNKTYTFTVWDTHTKSNILSLNVAHRRAARFVSGFYSRLEQRQRHANLVMMYNLTNNLLAIDSWHFLHRQNTSTRGHSMRYVVNPTAEPRHWGNHCHCYLHLEPASSHPSCHAHLGGLHDQSSDHKPLNHCMPVNN